MAEYRLSSRAQHDIEGIYDYTHRNFGERQADTYVEQIAQSAQAAAHFPFIGRDYQTRNGKLYRRYDCGRHALFYRQTEDGILIVRILHLMMDFDRHL